MSSILVQNVWFWMVYFPLPTESMFTWYQHPCLHCCKLTATKQRKAVCRGHAHDVTAVTPTERQKVLPTQLSSNARTQTQKHKHKHTNTNTSNGTVTTRRSHHTITSAVLVNKYSVEWCMWDRNLSEREWRWNVFRSPVTANGGVFGCPQSVSYHPTTKQYSRG